MFYLAISFLLIFQVVKSNVINATCKDGFNDVKNNRPIIDVNEYCKNKLCLTKCCGAGEVLNVWGQCIDTTSKKWFRSRTNYSNIDVYSWDGAALKKSPKKFTDFILVQNEKFIGNSSNCFYEFFSDREFFIMEDGSLKLSEDDSSKPRTNETRQLTDVDKLIFCVDYKVVPMTVNNVTTRNVKLVLRESLSTDGVIKSKFTVIATLVSCFFMILVLVVYALLRQLRKISGLMLMAYLLSLLLTYLLKAVIDIMSMGDLSGLTCKKLAPVFYFTTLSSFFWLNIMSFDVWWTLRGHRICRDVHRQGEVVKFLWYCLYGWGAPFAATATLTVVDNVDLIYLPVKPDFQQCFTNDDVAALYIYKPMGVIIGVNIIFFIMTAYNIWLTKKRFNNCQESRKSKKDTDRFGVYIKLSVLMGLGWSLSLLPAKTLTLYILVNITNMLIGVVIFFLFVFKKSIYIMLCKRLNIRKEYIRNLESFTSRTASASTGTTDTRSTIKSPKKPQLLESQL